MHEPFQRGPRLATLGPRPEVLGQPPTRIEGRTQHRYLLAAQERLKPCERSHRPHLVDAIKQRRDISIRQDHIRQLMGISHGPLAQTRHDIWVRFIEDHRFRISAARRFKKRAVSSDIACAQEDRRVILHLPRHQNATAFRQIGQGAAKVIFAHTAADQAPDHSLRPHLLIRAKLRALGDQRF